MNETTPVFPRVGQTVRLFEMGRAAGSLLIVSISSSGKRANGYRVGLKQGRKLAFYRDPSGDLERYVQDPGCGAFGRALNPCFFADLPPTK